MSEIWISDEPFEGDPPGGPEPSPAPPEPDPQPEEDDDSDSA